MNSKGLLSFRNDLFNTNQGIDNVESINVYENKIQTKISNYNEMKYK